MNSILTIQERNAVLLSMAELIQQEREAILKANKKDVENYSGEDIAMYDRLKVDDSKIKGMIDSLKQLASLDDPLGHERFHFNHENGLKISNKTAPFGTVMIIYESRPDVTIEAGAIAFKSGNKILLKGGKESLNSNLVLVNLWHKALSENGISMGWVEYLQFDRQETQAFSEKPTKARSPDPPSAEGIPGFWSRRFASTLF
jgi:glutamate-5-semialdehyde dehydrogenase